MDYISSDTNIWIDFYSINKLEIPFRMRATYIMFSEAMRDEIVEPPEMLKALTDLGLEGVSLSTKEFYYAMELLARYRNISRYDAIALSIAKIRGILLLSGDKALRTAAEKEKVKVMGSLGLIDQLLEEKLIIKREYREILLAWEKQVKLGRRLPLDEIKKRLEK